jgi:hypothetical protein
MSRVLAIMSIQLSKTDVIEVFSDASLLYGAWIDIAGRQKTFSIPPRFQYSSYASEFYAAQQAIRDVAQPGSRIRLHCDNQGVSFGLTNRRIAHPVRHCQINQLLTSLLSFMDDNQVRLSVVHIPSELNPADPISHHSPCDTERMLAHTMLIGASSH